MNRYQISCGSIENILLWDSRPLPFVTILLSRTVSQVQQIIGQQELSGGERISICLPFQTIPAKQRATDRLTD